MRFVTRAGLIVLALIHLEIVITIAEAGYDRIHLFYFGKSRFAVEAVYQIPGTYEEIVVERRAAHPFLAEYDRELIFRIGVREFARMTTAADSGGYCKMKLYSTSPSNYLLCGELSHDAYILDVTGRRIRDVGYEERFFRPTYIGVFDNDENGSWRFISANQRAEEKDKLTGSGCLMDTEDIHRAKDGNQH
jgi:hypothetical protein